MVTFAHVITLAKREIAFKHCFFFFPPSVVTVIIIFIKTESKPVLF